MKERIKNLLKSWTARIGIGVVLISLGLGTYYYFFSSGTTTQDYLLLGSVETGDINLSIAESGQVSDAEEIDLKPDASAKVTAVYVDEGSYVSAGQTLLALDSRDAALNVDNAEINLEQAQQDLADLGQPGSDTDITKAQNAVTEAQNSITSLTTTYQNNVDDTQRDIDKIQNEDLPTAYDSAYNEITNVFVDLPEAYGEIKDIVLGDANGQQRLSYYSDQIGTTEAKLEENKVSKAFSDAESSYNEALDLYQSTSRDNTDSLQELTDTTYNALSGLSNTLKEIDAFLTMVYEKHPTDSYMLADRSTVADNISTINPYLSSVYSEVQSIDDLNTSIEDDQRQLSTLKQNYDQDLTSANLTLQEKQLDLEDLQAPSVDDLDYKTQELVVRQKQTALAEAQESYQNYYLYAPVSGYISSWDASVGDSVSSGTSVGTLIDNDKQVVVSLNELDILSIDIGQTATITFDAIPDFQAQGVVVKKDIAGTVNSGVVSYDVTLSIQSDDERILTGMSSDVNIVLLSKTNVTVVSKVAVKEDSQGKYVEVVQNADSLATKPFYSPDEVQTEKVYFEAGTADDVNDEVVSGLDAGTKIVLSTISLSTDQQTTSTSTFGLPGSGTRTGGGNANFTPPSGGGGSSSFSGGTRLSF